jgi:drug/metabolite transporter (DMT)-like permease
MNKPRIDLSKRVWQDLTLVFLAMIWGSSFILMKKGLHSYSSWQVASFRIFFAFLLTLPFIIRFFRKINRKNIVSLLKVGFFGTAIPAYLFTTAQMHINSSLAGMLNSLTPIFTLILGLIFYNAHFKWINIIGVFVGLIGALGLVVKDINAIIDSANIYAIYIVVATFFYGISVNEAKHKLNDLKGVEISTLIFLFIGPLAGIQLLFSDFSGVTTHPDYLLDLFYIFLLALLSSFIAMIIFYTLMKHTTSVYAASVTYIIPIFAIIWGLIDGESVSSVQMMWISVIVLGLYMVNKKKNDV